MARFERKRMALGAALAIAVPLFAACNAITGLSDFEKGECPGRRCGDGSIAAAEGGPDVITDAPPEVRGADPVSWAQWPMPNYDAGTAALPNPLTYRVFAESIEDVVTGLVWRRAVLPSQLGLAAARAACAQLDPTTGPWRLPKRIELVTLLDFGQTTSLIDPHFDGVKSVLVWTSSELRTNAIPAPEPRFWTVDFRTGIVDTSPANDNSVANVLCVKGKS